MGRNPKFALPLSGRRTQPTTRDKDHDRTTTEGWQPRGDESKIERLLGASIVAARPSTIPHNPSQTSTNPPYLRQTPSKMSMTISEEPLASEYSAVASSTVLEDMIVPPSTHALQTRASSTVLGKNYKEDGGRSVSVASSRQVHHQGSSSTLRSFYDPKKSPLSVSQQTSASAVRDMALRKGYPPISGTLARSGREVTNSPIFPPQETPDNGSKKAGRRGKPARLDLSKLFPKPRSQNENNAPHLLSPTKLVRSPSQMSAASEYFPRTHAQQISSPPLSTTRSIRSLRSMDSRSGSKLQKSHPSPQRPVQHERNVLENAKVNVRRPPKGIQHWFEGLLEESDEDLEEEVPASKPSNVPQFKKTIQTPTRKSSLGRVLGRPDASRFEHPQPTPTSATTTSTTTAASPKLEVSRNRQRSPSNLSSTSYSTNRSKGNRLSMANLQSSSVLSMSSSEDEDDGNEEALNDGMTSISGHEDNIIIGKAQAFEVRPRERGPSRARDRSESRQSILSTSTGAGTIDIMLSSNTDPYLAVPRQLRGQRSGHMRYPPSIPEDGANQERPSSPANNGRTPASKSSRSDLAFRREQHKLMAVTEEEEQLLEMMRKKRAAMAKHSFTEGYKTGLKRGELAGGPGSRRGSSAKQESTESTPRTSGFLSTDSLNEAPLHTYRDSYPTRGRKPSQSSDTVSSGGHLHGRDVPAPFANTASANSFLMNEILGETSSAPSNGRQPYQLNPVLAFPPLDPFPSPNRTDTTASMASPTTASHASPLPSPITPENRQGDRDMHVKVAGSEASCNDDEDVSLNSSGMVDSLLHTHVDSKAPGSRSDSMRSTGARRRTASSDAEIVLGVESFRNSRSFPIQEFAGNHIPHFDGVHMHPDLTSRKPKGLPSSTSSTTRSASRSSRSGRASIASSSASYTPTASGFSASGSYKDKSGHLHQWDPKNNKANRRVSLAPSVATSCSVSEDVLAAWGSLGGWRDYEGRVGGV